MRQALIALTLTLPVFIAELKAQQPTSDSIYTYQVQLQGFDLSEDVNPSAFLKEELVVILYGETAGEFIGVAGITLDKLNRTGMVEFRSNRRVKNTVLVLAELDAKTDINTLESTIRNSFTELETFHRQHDLKGIRSIIAEDDLLHISTIKLKPANKAQLIRINGVQKGDTFDYQVAVSWW